MTTRARGVIAVRSSAWQAGPCFVDVGRRHRVGVALGLALLVASLAACAGADDGPGVAPEPVAVLQGVHDPGRIVRLDDRWVFFASAIEWWSADEFGGPWKHHTREFYVDGPPAWYDGDDLWAPGAVEVHGGLRVYHSAVIVEEEHASMIGFAEVSGSPEDLEVVAVDGPVVESTSTAEPFAIDPSVLVDLDDRHWLIYGSHAQGIVGVELDPDTGLLLEGPDRLRWTLDDDRFTVLASYGGVLDENNVEAAHVHADPTTGWYTLFVNWERCCSGVDSDYTIRVGRSREPMGPYLDRDGVDLADGGGTVFLDPAGEVLGDDRFVGPGHAGVVEHDGQLLLSHHFYDADAGGQPSWALWRVSIDEGWPSVHR